MKKAILLLIGIVSILGFSEHAHAGYVNGYLKDNGTYVSGYYRTEPNYYKYDNYSWNGDWSDSINDKSWYRDYGYDPEPYDYEYPSYNYWDSYDSYDYSYDYDYDWGY